MSGKKTVKKYLQGVQEAQEHPSLPWDQLLPVKSTGISSLNHLKATDGNNFIQKL